MRKILRITKTELITLFCSPIAWLILIIFTFQAGLTFSDLIGDLLRSKALGYRLYSVSSRLFLGYEGVFSSMLENLYLYIPLLTMGLMSREFSSGSVKLLYSSPVTNRQMILGKYFSMIIYALLLVGILSLYVLFGTFIVKDIDMPFILTGLLGVFLTVCAYAAIGLFMSCLTSYQIVAAVGTLALLAVLNFIGNVGQEIDFVRDITYWLSISGRAKTLIDGLICSEDVIYFLIVIVLFVILSMLKLQLGRKRRPLLSAILQYAGVVVIALGLGYFSSRPKLMCFHDSTETKQNTLTPNSQEVMKKLDGGLTITTYVNILDDNYWRATPARRNYDFVHFEKYVRFKPETKIKYVYYYDKVHNSSLEQRYPGLSDQEKAEEICKVLDWDINEFLTPEEIRQEIDLSGEGNRLVRLLERENGQKTFLRFYEDPQRYPSESEMTAALKRLVVKLPLVAFLAGHGERNIAGHGERDYGAFAYDLTFRYSLQNQGFDVISLSLDELECVPDEVDILVVAELKQPLTPKEQESIEKYIERGGNMIIAAEPRRQTLMNPLLNHLGVELMPGMLVQPTEDFTADLIQGNVTEEAASLSSGYKRLHLRNSKIVTPGAVGLRYVEDCGFKVYPLVVTSAEGVWNELQTTDFINEQPEYNPESGEEQGSIPTMLQLTRMVGEKEQRILIWGDADCISNGELTTHREGIKSSNFSVITESFGSLTYGEFPVDTSRPSSSDNDIFLSEKSELFVKILFMGVLPGVLIFLAIFIWWKRRGR